MLGADVTDDMSHRWYNAWLLVWTSRLKYISRANFKLSEDYLSEVSTKLYVAFRLPIGRLSLSRESYLTRTHFVHTRKLFARTQFTSVHHLSLCSFKRYTGPRDSLSLSLCLSLPPLEANTDYTEFHLWNSRRDSSPFSPPKSQSHSDPQKGYKRGVSGHSSWEHSHSSSSEH